MHTPLRASFLLLLVLLVTACTHAEEEIEIGAILALSGSIADQGRWVQNGLELAREELNDGTEGKRITLVYQDAQADPKLALSAYQLIRAQHDIPAVITMGSSVGISLTPIVNEDAVIQMGVATASPEYTTPDDYTFRVFETATLEAKHLADAIASQFGFGRIGVLWINNDYGSGFRTPFEKSFKELGGEVVFSEPFEEGETDFRSHLTKLSEKKPDAIVLVPYTKEGGLILKQAGEMGMENQFFSSQAILGGRELFDIAGEEAEGLIIASPEFDIASEREPIKSFREAYRHKYGEDPEIYGARAYDALKIIARALDACSEDTACIKEYLLQVNGYEGVSGSISFDRNGDVLRPFGLRQVRNGQIVVAQ